MTKEGTVLDGKYEIWKEVGRGGMSIVYLARDNRLNKQWAVKEIKNDGSKSTKTLLKGLEREANILKNVDHPVLPRIVDIINQEGTIYVVMDFIEGTTINDRLKKEGAQPQELVIEWGLQLASALDYLHNMNPPVIYRDMKPSNVMIKPEGGVKLIDFGTAKEYIIENNADTTALGTRGYAAPEQFGDSQGRGIYKTDARTDIYNLGATLYHIVTGKNPCEPPYEMKPIREWNPALSSGLEKIILKCTQPNPNDRYQNCSELMYALEHYTELDDAYKKKNKKKMAAFIATTVLTVAAGVTSLVGYAGLQKIKLNNYISYVETGNEFRHEGNYIEAAKQYKKAFELDGSNADAYEKYIDVHIEAHKQIREDGTTELKLEDGLNVVANRVEEGHGSVNKNAQVLYKLAITYFDELNDYKLANKYFEMIDPKDKEYGELAKYYGSVSFSLSSTNINAEELIDEINSFTVYNQNQYTNDNELKFVNYKTIGRIYATYVTVDGVAPYADEVMEQAIEELDEYTGNKLNTNDYFYAYCKNLIVINEQLAKVEEDEGIRRQYYQDIILYSDDCLNSLELKIEENENGIAIGGNSDNPYNTDYYNIMTDKADAYAAMGNYNDVIDTYEQMEATLGKNNVLSNKVYADHLDYIYSYCADVHQDPENWKKRCSSELEDLLAVYEEGQDVLDIAGNRTWSKRKATVDMLAKGLYDEEETTDDSEPTEGDDAEDGEMGE